MSGIKYSEMKMCSQPSASPDCSLLKKASVLILGNARQNVWKSGDFKRKQNFAFLLTTVLKWTLTVKQMKKVEEGGKGGIKYKSSAANPGKCCFLLD